MNVAPDTSQERTHGACRTPQLPSPELGSLPGTYVGVGAWTDIAGESKRYRVIQTISFASNEITIEYAHDFYEEGTATSGAFVLQRQTDALLRVLMKGADLGNGYMFGNYLHYYIKVGDICVQVSYQVTSDGLLVNGSSSSNAQGRFIAWHEDLRKRVDA
jgi:hypothetical protein